MFRSSGCRACRQKKIKCDETWPICINCYRAGRQCPGPQAKTQFIDETTKLRKKHEKGKADDRSKAQTTKYGGPQVQTSDKALLPLQSHLTIDETSSSDNFQQDQSDGGPQKSSSLIRQAFPDIPAHLSSPKLELLQHIQCLSEAISPNDQVQLWEDRRVQTRLIDQIVLYYVDRDEPQPIPLLESTMTALSLAHEGLYSSNKALSERAMYFYGRALRLLSQALSNPAAARASQEILTSTALLSIYEGIQSDISIPYIKHAGGVASLIKARGPSMHRTGYGREMFHNYQQIVLLEAFETGSACFLDKPEWRELSEHVYRTAQDLTKGDPGSCLNEIAYDISREMVAIPGLMQDVRNLPILMEEASGDPQTVIDDLAENIRARKDALARIFPRAVRELQNLGHLLTLEQSDDPVFPRMYRFVNYLIGRWFISHYAVQIITSTILKAFEPDTDIKARYDKENYEHAIQICQSWEDMNSYKLAGTFIVIIGLQLSLKPFKDDPVKNQWVIDKLLQLAGKKAGIAAEIEPHDPDEDIMAPGIRNVLKEAEALAR